MRNTSGIQVTLFVRLDPPRPPALAVAESRPAIHVAWAAHFAATRDDDAPLDVPGGCFRVGHDLPLYIAPFARKGTRSGRSTSKAAPASKASPMPRPNARPRGSSL